MSDIKDSRFIADGAVRDQDILLDNNDWLIGRNQAGSGNVNLLKLDTSDRLHLGDAASGKPIVMGAQLASDPTGVTAGFYYNTTDNAFRFYNGTSWAAMGGGVSYPLLAPNGSGAAPSYSFTSQPDTGMYCVAGVNLGLAVDGATKINISSTTTILQQNAGPNSVGINLGNSGTPFGVIGSTEFRAKSAGNADYLFITGDQALTSPSGVSINTTIRKSDNSSSPLGIWTENTGTAVSKSIYIESGSNTSTGSTGLMRIQTGPQTGTGSGGSKTGDVEIFSGAATGDGLSGKILIKSGSSVNQASGDIELETGAPTSGVRGRIKISARSMRLPVAASAPTATEAGEMYYDTTTNKSYTWDGSTWQAHW